MEIPISVHRRRKSTVVISRLLRLSFFRLYIRYEITSPQGKDLRQNLIDSNLGMVAEARNFISLPHTVMFFLTSIIPSVPIVSVSLATWTFFRLYLRGTQIINILDKG